MHDSNPARPISAFTRVASNHPVAPALWETLMTRKIWNSLTAASLVAGIFSIGAGGPAIAVTPLELHTFDKLDPPSIRPGDFGIALDASNGKVLVGGFGVNSYLYDV